MSTNAGFELHGLQKLFATFVTAQNQPERLLFDPRVIHEYVLAEVARIKHRLIEKALTIQGEDAVARYVRIHQYAVVTIMDKLFQRRDRPGAMQCCDVLDDLFSFFNEQFPQYFDEMGKAPSKHIHECRVEIALSYASLERRLLNVCSFEPLAFMVVHPLQWFYVKGDEQRVSFNRLRYLRYIMEHAKKVVQDRGVPDPLDRNLVDLLIYLNYNSRKTFRQFIRFLRDLLPEDLDSGTKRDTLIDYLTIVSQAPMKPDTGYHPGARTLKGQLIDHITAELKALYEKDKRPEPGESVEPMSELPVPTKVKFDLSVAQLACLMRLLRDTGIVSSDNMSALIRSVALHCETKRSSSISPESLRIKFYDVESGTQRAVRLMLDKLLKSVDKMSSSN